MVEPLTAYDMALTSPEIRLIQKIRIAKRDRKHTVLVVTVNERGIIITMEAVPDWKIATNGNCGKIKN